MPVKPQRSEEKTEVLYVATLRHGADEVELEVEEVGELNLTGEGEVPLTTRLGDLSLSVVVTPRLLEILNRVADYRDVSVELVDITNGRCLFAGVGDRAGWSTEITDASRTADLAFVSKLAAQDPTDVHDVETSRAYDTLSWSRALEKVADLADVTVGGSLEDLEFDNVSICRRVTSRLAGADYAVGERAGGLAVIPTGVAVGVGPRVMWTNGTAYLPLARIWYKNTGHDFDAEVGGRAWTIIALGYRDGQLYGLAGLVNLGIVARFSCSATPRPYGNWPGVKIEGADCFRWWFDLCAVRGSFTQWKIYGGTDAAYWSIYAVGWPTPDTTKELGVPKMTGRIEAQLAYVAEKGANHIAVYKDGPLKAARVGDYIDVGQEFCGVITRFVHKTNALWIVFTHKLSRQYGWATNVYAYRQGSFPTDNLLFARPTPVIIHYHDPWQWGGNKKCDIKGLRRRHRNSSGSRFYAPVTVDDVTTVDVGPGYVTLQAEAALMEYASKISYSPTPRNFDAYIPGRCVFPPDVANHIIYRQSRIRGGIYSDQGPVQIYCKGTALGNNKADGAVVTSPRYRWPGWEDWEFGKYLTITADPGDALPAGYTFRYSMFGHVVNPYYDNYSDVRILYKVAGVWKELDRDILNYSNIPYVAFALQEAVAAGASIKGRYAILWRAKAPGTAKADKANIYANNDECNNLATWDVLNGTAVIDGGALKVTSTPAAFRANLVTSTNETDLTILVKTWRTGAKALKGGPVARANAAQTLGAWAEDDEITNHFRLIKLGGTTATAAQVYVNGAEYWVEIKITGADKWWGRTWKDGDSIPAWMLTRVLAVVTNTEVGLRTEGSAKDQYFDDVMVMYAVENEPVITTSDRFWNSRPIVIWEDLAWREGDNCRYPVLKIGAVDANGKLVQMWQNREPDDPYAVPEYYISSALVDHGGKIYGAIRVRDRVWKDINATVIAVGPDESTNFEPGSLPLMFNKDLSDLIDRGAEIRVGTRSPAVYTVAEISPQWRIFNGEEAHICDNLGAYNGPATVLGLSDVDGIVGGELATKVMKDKYCGQKLKLATSTYEYWAIFEYDPGGPTFTIRNQLIYDTGWPRIDEEAEFARENVRGETLEPEDDAPVGWALYKAANRNPLDETHVRVWANKHYMNVVSVTGRLSLPAPEYGKAYINYRAGDDADELWVYLPDRYLDADVVVRYDYYPGVPITAVWPWNGDIYFASADGYLWKVDFGIYSTRGECIGRLPDGDYPLEWVEDGDTTWLLTAAGRLAKHDRYHSGCIEGDFGGDDQDLFHLVAEIARASGTPVRETPDGLQLGGTETVNLEEHDVVRVGERPVRDVRALEVEYSDGTVVAGNAKTKAEQTASLPTPLIYTPQHAKAVAELAWDRLASAHRRVVLEGVSADPMIVALATSATYSNSVYEILRLGILQNDYRVEARDVTPSLVTPTLPQTEVD